MLDAPPIGLFVDLEVHVGLRLAYALYGTDPVEQLVQMLVAGEHLGQ